MSEHDYATAASAASGDLDALALLDRVAAAMLEIEQAKRERSTETMRAARTHLAALHGVARLRRQAERQPGAA